MSQRDGRGSRMRPRFERMWAEWDRAIHDGKNPVALIRGLVDDTILELLASGGSERQYEHDVLMTELQNRLARARRELDAATEAVVVANERLREHLAAAARYGEESRAAEARLSRHRDVVRSRAEMAVDLAARGDSRAPPE